MFEQRRDVGVFKLRKLGPHAGKRTIFKFGLFEKKEILGVVLDVQFGSYYDFIL